MKHLQLTTNYEFKTFQRRNSKNYKYGIKVTDGR